MRAKLVSFLALFLAGIFILSSCKEEAGAKEEEFLPLVKVWKAEQKKYEHKIQVQGNVETDRDVVFNAEMGGTITRVHVQEGQRVSAGQVLVSLDASILSSNANEIKTQLGYAEYMLSKQEELKNRGLGTEFDYEAAKSQVNALKSRMASVNTQRGKSSIVASFSGVVNRVYAREGQVVGPQNPLVRVVDNGEVSITADVSEKHYSAIKVGTQLEVTFPNYSDTVIFIPVNTVSQFIEPVNRTFRILSKLNNNRSFLPNMLAEIAITDMEVENALVISSKGIIKDQNNQDFVYVAYKKNKDTYSIRKVMVEVISKYKQEAYIRVLSGDLAPGDLVITDGSKGITEKDKVRISK
jgi:membrane fusion protein, multidrug efflux system